MPDETLERNKGIVRRMLKAFNDGDTASVAELLHPSIRDHSRMLGLEPSIRRAPVVKRVQTEIMREKEAFPDKRFKEEFIVAEGDRVVLRWSMTGTHQGRFVGRGATGKKVSISGTEFVRIQDGKIIEHDDDPLHVLELLAQLDMLDQQTLALPEFSHDRVSPRRNDAAPGRGGPPPAGT
ncbi:ester cyclase [Longimicrobium sp.]|uniref:ester cyclase n=1 Tax=Longimicrobium sp. TaxID=2029185 RepID=UPI002E314E95|nr:ester cyclase [Longimicrobium sp.]HEX6040439.1 ester cyclase [Longimicrobium sp.]